MAEETAKFFEQLDQRGHEPLLEHATGTIRFDLVQGKRTDRWFVSVKNGDIAVSHENGEADVVVTTDEAVFDQLVSGEQNAMAALLRGAVGVEGRVQLLAQFQRLLPAPPKARRRRRQAAGSARSRK
jgi:putative sterol carrier protein